MEIPLVTFKQSNLINFLFLYPNPYFLSEKPACKSVKPIFYRTYLQRKKQLWYESLTNKLLLQKYNMCCRKFNLTRFFLLLLNNRERWLCAFFIIIIVEFIYLCL